MKKFRIYSFFLVLATLSFQSVAIEQEYKFPPFPKSELAYWYDIIESTVKDEQENHSYTHIYQGVQFHTLFNEGSDIAFTVRHRTGGPFALEEIARYQFSCKSQKLLVIERHFNAYENGVQIGKGDELIRTLADTVFEEGKSNLLTILTATCKFWESNQQIKNNASFHSFLLNGHSIILNRMLTNRNFIPSLMLMIGPDYFFEYHGDKKSKTEAYNLLGLTGCNVSNECWNNYDIRVASIIMGICFEEHERPIEFQSNYCKETKYQID